MSKMRRKDGENGDYIDGRLTNNCNFANEIKDRGYYDNRGCKSYHTR